VRSSKACASLEARFSRAIPAVLRRAFDCPCVGTLFRSGASNDTLPTKQIAKCVIFRLDDNKRETTTTVPDTCSAASPPGRLADVRRKLCGNRLTTPLFDAKLYTRHIEAAYSDIAASRRAQ